MSESGDFSSYVLRCQVHLKRQAIATFVPFRKVLRLNP
jgi:hypothetical protein